MLRYHIIGFFLGFVLDQLIGDPYPIPHPVVWIGRWIAFLEVKLFGKKEEKREQSMPPQRQQLAGVLLVFLVVLPSVLIPAGLLLLLYHIHPAAGIALETWMTCQLLAAKSLRVESMKVYDALAGGDLAGGRKAVSMIVGRDTQSLDEAGVARAAIETVAENASDGVIAPMLAACIGGPVLGWAYKAVNTMDSMVGYHNDRYEHFGTAAARFDDICNFIPARLSALLMILAAGVLGPDFNAANAYRIFRRDRYNHKSPNSAQTESVCAGALGIRLAGDASYFGKVVRKPYIGDADRDVEYEDIRRANTLMNTAAWLGAVIMTVALTIIMIL